MVDERAVMVSFSGNQGPTVKVVDEWALRHIFNNAGYWLRIQQGDLIARQPYRMSEHKDPCPSWLPWCSMSQFVEYVDARNQRVVGAHQYLLPDGTLHNGRPDPKFIVHNGVIHKLGGV